MKVCSHGDQQAAPCGDGWCLEPSGHTTPHTGQQVRCSCRSGRVNSKQAGYAAAVALVQAGFDPYAVALATCEHYRVVPVESCVNGELLAMLCLDCDAQLGPAWADR